jgi:hypothetical protein
VPRIVIIPSPVFEYIYAGHVGGMLDPHLDVIVEVDDEWRDLIPSDGEEDLKLRLRMAILDAVSGCATGIGVECPAVALHHRDIELLWLADDGTVRFISVKEAARRGEILYVAVVEPPEGVRLLRLQTFKPLEYARFFEDQFENLGFEFYEMLYESRGDVNRWRRITRAGTLPSIAEAVAGAARRFVMELCVFGEYNVCPGILLNQAEGRVDVKILKITSKPETNYISRIDLAGLLAPNR